MTAQETTKIDALTETVEDLKSDIKDIRLALLGSEYAKESGIVPRLKAVEEWKEETSKQMAASSHERGSIKRFARTWGGVIVAASAIIYEIIATIKNWHHL